MIELILVGGATIAEAQTALGYYLARFTERKPARDDNSSDTRASVAKTALTSAAGLAAAFTNL